jgi:[FeFe] hydrogenase H-cluster maturation GTPase HydF
MQKASKGMRLQIGIFGRRNAGKSSVLNTITRQDVAIVSPVPGTTTDPIEKPMELLPFGPVLFIDTAGLDDVGALGEKRIERSRKIIERTELALLVVNSSLWGEFEESLLQTFRQRQVSTLIIFNKTDVDPVDENLSKRFDDEKQPWISMVACRGEGLEELRTALLTITRAEEESKHNIIGDLVAPGDVAVLVIPIDKEAPKGRIILPQVQTMRDLLDHHAIPVVCTDVELEITMQKLVDAPKLVVTDSQAFAFVKSVIPEDQPLTSFSILFARYKGNLSKYVAGAQVAADLKDGDKVLVAEACTHHPIGDDIGRVKIPDWLQDYTQAKLNFDTVQGHDFPENLHEYKLVVHCGACMFNPKQVNTRHCLCDEADVPMTNYGVLIAKMNGILDRAIAPMQIDGAIRQKI